MRYFLPAFFILVFNTLNAQDQSEVFFDRGVDAFQKRQYREADSLFTESLVLLAHRDTYYSRAAARQQLRDQAGYCSDLAHASVLGDREADSLFKQGCGKVRRVFLDQHNREVEQANSAYTVIRYESRYDPTVLAIRLDSKNNFVNSFYIVNDTSRIYSDPQTVPEFPGGVTAMYRWIGRIVEYPRDAMENGISGEVRIRFVVEKSGITTRHEVVKDIKGYPSMSKAAIKAIEQMPPWRPGKVNGKPVRTTYEMPMRFKIM